MGLGNEQSSGQPAPGRIGNAGRMPWEGQVFNPNTEQSAGVADAISPFLQAIFGGQNPFGAMASPLQQQAVGNLQTFLGMPAPETRALGQAQPALNALLGGQPMQNPFGGQGEQAFDGFSAGQQVVNAAQPVFNQNLQGALTQVANRAPSIRNSAFGDQASGLAQRALSDFNLFQQQALQQGQQLDLQNRAMGQQFALGAGQLAQAGQLGGLGALGQLSSAAGQNPFGRQLAAGQLGLGITGQNVNPLLQLMLGGMDFGRQFPLDAIIRQDDDAGGGGGGLGSALATLIGAFAGTKF